MKALSKKTCRIVAVLAAVCLAVAGFAVWYQNRGFFHEGDEEKIYKYIHQNKKYFDWNDPSVYSPIAVSRGDPDQTHRWESFLKNTKAGKKDYIIVSIPYFEGSGTFAYISYQDGKYYMVQGGIPGAFYGKKEADPWENVVNFKGSVYTNLTDYYYSDYDYFVRDETGYKRRIHAAWLSNDPDFDPEHRWLVKHKEVFLLIESQEEMPVEKILEEEANET